MLRRFVCCALVLIRVYMLSRNEQALEAAAKDVPGAICVPTDVTKRNLVHASVDKVMSDSGKIDIVVK